MRSRRPDYVSLFAMTAGSGDRKRCRADAGILKEAVAKLKQRGFAVEHVGSCSIHIRGSRGQFATTFGITLSARVTSSGQIIVQAQPAGGSPSGVSPSSLVHPLGGELQAYLASLLFPGPTAWAIGETPPAKVDQAHDLYLSEIRGLLGSAASTATGRDIRVAVADSGVYAQHPWFTANQLDSRIRLVQDTPLPLSISEDEVRYYRVFQRFSGQVDDWVKAAKTPSNLSDAQFVSTVQSIFRHALFQNDVAFLLRMDPKLFSALKVLQVTTEDSENALLQNLAQTFADLQSCVKHAKTDELLDCFAPQSDQFLRDTRHGTAVVANLFAVATGCQVELLDCESSMGEYAQRFSDTVVKRLGAGGAKKSPQLINCSWSSNLTHDDAADAASRQAWRNVLDRVAGLGSLLITTAGNRSLGTKPTEPSIEASVEHDAMLVVGGAFFAGGTTPGSPAATNVACAYPADTASGRRAVPDICGLVAGPAEGGSTRLRGLIYVPQDLDDWDAQTGTSYAAPQVAAVCALLLEAWTHAPPQALKAIMQETARIISQGEAFNPYTQSGYLWNNVTHKVGLVQIDRALQLARFLSTVNLHGRPVADALNDLRTAAQNAPPSERPPDGLWLDRGQKWISLEQARTALTKTSE